MRSPANAGLFLYPSSESLRCSCGQERVKRKTNKTDNCIFSYNSIMKSKKRGVGRPQKDRVQITTTIQPETRNCIKAIQSDTAHLSTTVLTAGEIFDMCTQGWHSGQFQHISLIAETFYQMFRIIENSFFTALVAECRKGTDEELTLDEMIDNGLLPTIVSGWVISTDKRDDTVTEIIFRFGTKFADQTEVEWNDDYVIPLHPRLAPIIDELDKVKAKRDPTIVKKSLDRLANLQYQEDKA